MSSADPTDLSVIDTIQTFTQTVNGEVITTIVTGRATVTPTAAIAQATASSDGGGGGGLHGGSKTAVAVVVPIGGVALISAAAFYFWKKKSRKTFADQRLSTSSRSHSPSDSFSNTLSTTQLAGGVGVPQYRGWDMTGGGNAAAAGNGVNGSINSGSGSGLGLVSATGAGVASSASSTTAVGPTRTQSRGAASRTHSRAASLSMGPIDEDLDADGAAVGDPFKSAADEEYEPSPDTHGLNMNTSHARRPSNFSNFSMTGDSPPVSPTIGGISANF